MDARRGPHPGMRVWVLGTLLASAVALAGFDGSARGAPSAPVRTDSAATSAPAREPARVAAAPLTGVTQASELSVRPVPSTDITSVRGSLYLGGAPYRFVGVNAYEIASDWGVNGSCGTMASGAQLDRLFAALPANSLVRFWAWQGTAAIDITTHRLDWGPLDRVFATAARYHQRLIVVLAGQSGACDDGVWKSPSWYDGGFMTVHDPRGLTPLSYWHYVQAVVSRYRSSPALGMWEPISEPEASTCPARFQPSNCGGHQVCPSELQAEAALRHFFDVVGTEIHTLDPDHLVESGTIGSGQCGASGPNYANVSASPGIDVLSYHDYSGAMAMPGDAWNGLALRLGEAAALHKPIIEGEVGLLAGPGRSCASWVKRATQFETKAAAQLRAGVSGLLVWNWTPSAPASCSFDTYPGDPLMADLAHGPPG